MLQINSMSTCEIDLRWISQGTFGDKWTLVPVLACCFQATCTCPRHCLTRSMVSLCHNEWKHKHIRWVTRTGALVYYFCHPYIKSSRKDWMPPPSINRRSSEVRRLWTLWFLKSQWVGFITEKMCLVNECYWWKKSVYLVCDLSGFPVVFFVKWWQVL